MNLSLPRVGDNNIALDILVPISKIMPLLKPLFFIWSNVSIKNLNFYVFSKNIWDGAKERASER